MEYIAGVDEAGRGPVLGPMVMSIVASRKQDNAAFNKLGIKDSKVVPKLKRKKLARRIKEISPNITIKVSPKEIDKALRSETSSLNELEAKTTARLITRLFKIVKCKEVMLDLPSKNKEQYIASVKKYLPTTLQSLTIKAEFKADENYVYVSAASILAKVARDASILAQEKRLKISLGSGYPADPNTIIALKKHFSILDKEYVLRKEWKTVKNILEAKKQSSLGDF